MFPLCFTLDQNGTLTTMSPNNAVSLELLAEIHKWYSEGAKQDDAVERLKLKNCHLAIRFIAGQKYTTVDFDHCTFILYIGKDKTKVKKLHSILAQLEYTNHVNLLPSKGINFKDHVYIPKSILLPV